MQQESTAVSEREKTHMSKENPKPATKFSKPNPVPYYSDIKYCDKYQWIDHISDEPIDFSIFDTRTRNYLKRYKFRTWGHLGQLTDETMFAAPNIGEFSVNRINAVLGQYGLAVLSRINAATALDSLENSPGHGLPDPKTLPAFEWTRIYTDEKTLRSLFHVCQDMKEAPAEAVEAMEILLSTPAQSLFGHEAPLLSDLIDELLSEVGNSEIVLARECSQERKPFRQMGVERGVTGESIRRMIARSTKSLHEALKTRKYRCIRWSIQVLKDEFGLAIPIDHSKVEQWQARLGDYKFEFLRWLAGYVHQGHRLQIGRSAWTELRELVDDAIGEKWLVEAEDVLQEVKHFVRPDVALRILTDSGDWRDNGDGRLVKWTGTIMDKAERVIRMTGKPMTPKELKEAIGHGSIGSFKNWQGSNLIRVDKHFRLAPRDWGMEQYEGITTEIHQRIERGGGVASVKAMIEEFVEDFGVRERSVRAYLDSGPYVILGDEVRHLNDRSYTPRNVSGLRYSVRIGDKWGQRFVVSEANMKGHSFNLDRDIAAHNGLKPDDSLLVPVYCANSVVGEASLIWRLSNLNGTVDVGRLSSVLVRLEINTGDKITIVVTPESTSIIRDCDLPPERRSIINEDVRHSLFRRK